MSILYLVSAKLLDQRFIYETEVSDDDALLEDLVNDIVSGEYAAGSLYRICRVEWPRGKVDDVTVEVAEAVREAVVASGKEPIPLVRDWINWVGIDPIVIRDGH